ncbi:MAG: polysaccharide biosynthesis C-terminal domain-containing protein [Clostridia bacterium]|nr:polysaccharide biosynthesis C-terminal domain-containing protein [Clostridia bacterium]
MNRRAGVVLSYVLMILEILSTLLLTPFIIRTLGRAEYGVFKLVTAVNAYLLLLDLGVGNAVTRYIAKYRTNGDALSERRFFGVSTVFYAAVALLCVIIGAVLVLIFPAVFAKGLTAEESALGQKLLFITMLNSAVTLGTASSNNVIPAYERFYVSRGAAIIQIILRMGLTFAALELGFGSLGIVCVNLAMTVLCRAFYLLYVRYGIGLRPMFRGIKPSFIKEIITYSSLIFVQMIATQLNATVDQVLIGSLVAASSTILAVYGVGAQVVQYFQSIGSAFTGVLMPGVVRLVESGGDSKAITREMIRVGRMIFTALLLIWAAFLVNGREFISLWAGEEYTGAYFVAILLMSAYSLTLTQAVGSQMLWAKNEHKEQAFLKLAVVLLNIALTVALILWRPLEGAAIGTFISIAVGDIIVMNLIFRRKLGVRLGEYYSGLLRGILPCGAAAAAIGFAARLLLPEGWLWFVIKCALMAAVYTGAMLLFGMNAYEKGLLASIFNKLKRRGGK